MSSLKAGSPRTLRISSLLKRLIASIKDFSSTGRALLSEFVSAACKYGDAIKKMAKSSFS